MTGLFGALDRVWLAPGSAKRLALLRALVGAFASVYLIVRAPVLADFRGMAAERFEPVGLAALLGAPLPASLAMLLWMITLLFCIAFTLGFRFRWTGPACALALLFLTSYRNSWGMVFHTDNLLVLHVLVLGMTPASAHALSLDAAHADSSAPVADSAAYGWPVRLVSLITLATYVLAGIAKLKLSGLHWAGGEVLRSTIAHDAVRKIAVGSMHSPLGAWLVQYTWPFPILGAVTLLLELGAPLALLGGRVALVWATMVWMFHVGVLATMAIAFPYPLSGVALASLFPLERWAWLERTVCRLLARVNGLR